MVDNSFKIMTKVKHNSSYIAKYSLIVATRVLFDAFVQ